MSVIGNPIATSLVQAAQAQQVAAKGRDSERAERERNKLREDKVELRVDDVEAAEAIHQLPSPGSEEHAEEEEAGRGRHPYDEAEDDEPDRPRIDVQA